MSSIDYNSLKDAIQSIPKTNSKFLMEIIGIRKDMYQNIIPILYDINIISDNIDEYNVKKQLTKSDCILLDGPGRQYTTSEYYIKFDNELNKYNVTKQKQIDILEPYNYFINNNLYFY